MCVCVHVRMCICKLFSTQTQASIVSSLPSGQTPHETNLYIHIYIYIYICTYIAVIYWSIIVVKGTKHKSGKTKKNKKKMRRNKSFSVVRERKTAENKRNTTVGQKFCFFLLFNVFFARGKKNHADGSFVLPFLVCGFFVCKKIC